MNQLLISIQSETEFELARSLGASWIDLKDPAKGSLGCPDAETAARISDRIAFNHLREPGKPRQVSIAARSPRALVTSVALGELIDSVSMPLELSGLAYDYAKVALRDCSDWQDWRDRVKVWAEKLPVHCELILVYYADRHLARCPVFDEVLAMAAAIGSPYVLIDTYSKQAGWLGDWLSVKEIEAIRQATHQRGIKLSLAGSLRYEALGWAKETGADVIAVRGAACREGIRSGTLCQERLTRLIEFFEPTREKLGTGVAAG